MGAPQQALVMGGAADNLNDIPMVARYECWRESVLSDGTATGIATDLSGNGNDATSSGSSRPVYKTSQINGLPVWRFSGSGPQFLETASIPAMNNTEVRWYFFVVKMISKPNVVNGFFAGANSGNSNLGDLTYFLNNPEQQLYSRYIYGSSGVSTVATGVDQGTSIFRLHSLILPGSGGTLRRKIGPGAYAASDTQSSGAPNGTFKLIIGDLLSSASGNGANCDIAAFFMGNGSIDAAAALRIEAYFLRVYGVTA